MVRYDKDSVIYVEWFDAEPDTDYYYDTQKTFFGIVFSRGGFRYAPTPGGSCLVNDIPPNHIIIGCRMCYKPRVVVYLRDNHTDTTYFKTVQEAEEFADSVLPTKNKSYGKHKRRPTNVRKRSHANMAQA